MRTSGTITSRLRHLERAGLVERRRSDADGRSLLVTLTERGAAVIDAAAPVHVANERRLLGSLTADEQQMLAGLLRKLLIDLEQNPPPEPLDAPPPPVPGRRRRSGQAVAWL